MSKKDNEKIECNLFYIGVDKKYPNATPNQQIKKVEEELNEIIVALNNNDDENLIEECWDLIQATLGILEIKGLKNEFKDNYKVHREKMIKRGYELEDI